MARHTWTLALIIICLAILATVITAFRVRDLPKALESVKAESKQKCDDCDANIFKDKRSVKIESATKRYEELKKAVKEKQQELKKAPGKNYKFVDDSADGDDDESELMRKETKTKLEGEKATFVNKEKKEKEVKKETVNKRPIVFKIHDDDDDDDEDEDDIQLKSKHKSHNVKNKVDTSLVKKGSVNDDEDVDSDSNEKSIKLIKNKPESNQKSKDSNIATVKKSNKIIDKVDADKISDKKQKEHDSKKTPELDDKPKDTKVKKELNNKISSIGKDDDDDDDDEDDDDDVDDDDDDDSDEKYLKTKNKNKDKVTSIQKVKSGTIEKDKERKVNDDDDEDDEDDDDDNDDKVILSKPGKKVVKPEKTAPNLKIVEEKIEVLKESKQQKLDGSKNLKKEQKVLPKQEDKKVDDKQKTVLKTEKKDDSIKKPKEVEKQKPKTEIRKADPKENREKPKESKKHEKVSKNILKADHSVEMLLDSSEIYGKSDQIKHVSDALQRRNLLQSEFEDFYAFFPTFAPNFSRIHNPECRRHGQILLRQLRGTKLWALNILDSTAKIPSGLLQGNGIQLGEFDQCINSRAKVQLDTGSVVKVQGQYCLARLEVKAEHEELEIPVHLAQARNLIKSRIHDPGHFVPRFSTLSWGVCLPSACDPEDAEIVIKDALKHYQHRSGLVIRVKVDEDDCHTLETDWWDEWLELPTILTLAFYSVIILLVLIATIQDFVTRGKSDVKTSEEGGTDEEPTESKYEEKEPEQKSADPNNTYWFDRVEVIFNGKNDPFTRLSQKWSVMFPGFLFIDGFLSSFSLYRSMSKLTAPSTTDEIACIHGVRGVATIALLIAHKFLPVAVMPYTNRLKITELASSPLWSWARAGWMYTDCFLLLSGALTAHRISDSESGAPWRLFTRYLRLTPALFAIVLFYAYVWDLVSVGPMWGSLVTKNAQVCQEGWWWNLLYVQNYFGFEDMCAPQTHQLALDMQLTIIGGIIVWALQSRQIVSKVILPSLHVLAAYSRYTTTSEHRLTLLAYHGVTVSQLYRTARLSYTSILHRSTPYLIGISLGLALRKPKEHGKIFLIFGWLISTILWCSVWWAGLDSGSITYKYSSSFSAQYSTFAPIASAVAIAWVIYAVHNNNSGFLSRLLCSRPLAFISRLSYALYLCQFIVFLTNAATVRTATEFTLLSLIDVQEISAILLSSTILTLTFVIPMQSLHKLFTFAPKQESDESDKREDNQEQKEPTDVPEESTESPEDKEGRQNHIEETIDAPQIRSRPSLLAHREFLEEIPEVELEYEMQRDKLEGLEEILEEEEDDCEVDDEEMVNHMDDDELEVIEEEGGEDFWADREEYTPRSPRRSYDVEDDGEEWEYTANGIENGRGAQYYRYSR